MNAISGRIDLEVGGVRRSLVCDMNAGAAFYEKYGEHWTLWLIERFVGKPVVLPGGAKGYRTEKMPPADLIAVLFALLATDREDSGREDSEKALRRSFGLADMFDLQSAVTRAVVASFGIPGEGLEVVAGAADAPHGSGRAGMHGIGTRVLSTALGPLGLMPSVFWRLTLAEWRAMLDGYEQKQEIAMRERAWTVSHLLIAAGCDAEKVTIAKLLGEKEKSGRPELSADDRRRISRDKIWKRIQKDRAKNGVSENPSSV